MLLRLVISRLLDLVELIIIIECLISWVPSLRYSRFGEMIHSVTSPFLEPCRRLQDRFGMNMPIDFSPIIAFIIIHVIRRIIF